MSAHAGNDALARALQAGTEEKVEINQRGLVEKILARYSGEHTLFRELLQNADDASASAIEVHFQTPQGSAHPASLKGVMISRITVRNNGIIFREEDWRRLKTIADGQPDESRIGAFGVGFYSIFSESDEPLVVSGDSMMLFFWKGDQLAVKRAANPRENGSDAESRSWTSIHMPCRVPTAFPDPSEFAKFLCTALAFTSHIKTMVLKLDNYELCRLERKAAPSSPLPNLPGVNMKSPGRMMTVASTEVLPLQLDCRIMRGALYSQQAPIKKLVQDVKTSFATKFLSFATNNRKQVAAEAADKETPQPSSDPTEYLTSSTFLKIVTGQVQLSMPSAIKQEFERATKKSPPKFTRLQVLFTSRDEVEASDGPDVTGVSARYVFSGLTQELGKQGRVFIGFPTHQSVGCSASIAGQFLPSVERENIDLQSRAVSEYNKELLAVSGILCRCIYDGEMQDMATQWQKLGPAAASTHLDEFRSRLIRRASHLMAFFTFYPATPFTEAGRIIQSSFFACNTREYLLVSNQGILSTASIRMPAPDLHFLSGLPVVAADAARDNAYLLEQLQDRNLIRTATLDDVLTQLQEKPLDVDEASAFFKWWISLSWNDHYDASLLPKLRNAAVITVPSIDGSSGRVVQLSSVKTYLNTKTLSPDLPLPSHVLPYAISRNIPASDLARVFSFNELSVLDWVRYLISPEVLGNLDTSLTLSAPFAERAHGVLAKVWGNTPPPQTAEICRLLKDVACIPTKKGMHIPAESYLPKVTLFDDLPVTTLTLRGSMEKMLIALGIRTHVDLALVFLRLLGGGQWQQEQVARYLVSVSATLTPEEKDRLTKTAWLTKEELAGAAPSEKPERYQARKLYEPNDHLRDLGLPILAWTGSKWRNNSDEARLLFGLGLRRHPPIEDILKLAADPANAAKQERARTYFFAHFETAYNQSYQPSQHAFAFVPVMRAGQATFSIPSEAYSAPGSGILGFATLRPEFQLQAAKFKLAADPKPAALVAALVADPPRDPAAAMPIFAYLAGQASRFGAGEYATLANTKFIPGQNPAGQEGVFEMYNPRQVYFKTQEGGLAPHFRSLFVFVDFGTAPNAFLLQCGVRAEPSTAELTQLLLADPKRFLTLAGSADRYISLLRQVAAHYSTFSGALKKRMRDTPFILGYEQVRAAAKLQQKSHDDDDDDEILLQCRLGYASETVIIDDTTTLNDFREFILSAPQDDLIEAFVEDLGGKRISKLVSTQYTSSPVPEQSSPQALQLRKLVLERAALFLHERQQTSKDVRFNEDWLKTHLIVKEVANIERQRILTLGVSRHVKTSPASAAATLGGSQLLLRVSSNMDSLDYYEVAASLTGLILNKQRIHDTLLFLTLLQTSLKDLKRRGFNVDRIMNSRKAEQEAQLQKERENRAQADLQRLREQEQTRKAVRPPSLDEKSMTGSFPDVTNETQALLSKIQQSPHAPPVLPPRSLFDNLRSKLRQQPPPAGGNGSQNLMEQALSQPNGNQSVAPSLPSKHTKHIANQPDSQSAVTPLDTIARNVHQAIQACKPDRSGDITSTMQTEEVKESNGQYCDSTTATDLLYVGDVSSIRLYVGRAVNEDIMGRYRPEIELFVNQILKPVGAIYNVDPGALHIFHDPSSKAEAFNRSGSIFFSLTYYLQRHAQKVAQGQLSGALISTYISMAHELAHNLVLQHSAQHSYYTEYMAEIYFLPLAGYIAEHSAASG